MEELIKLQEEYFNGNKEARERIIMCNQRLVYMIAKKYSGDSDNLLINIQNGNLGLIKAIEKFDASMGYTFSTYATNWIESFITRNKIDHKSLRVSEHLKLINNKIDKFVKMYYINNGKKPTRQEIIEALDLTNYSVQNCFDSRYKVKSLNDVVNKDSHNQMEFIDLVESENNNILDKEDEIYNEELRQAILAAMDSLLSQKEKIVMEKLFNLNDEGAMTLKQVADEFGVTPQRIGYIKCRSLKKLSMNSNLMKYAKML